jgi:intein-encoded DNA endonuclease-like protein
MAKLKKILKENFSVVGGMVSVPAVNAGYGSLTQLVKEKYGEQTQKVSSEQVKEALQNYNKLGEALYQQQSLKETAKSLSQIAEMAATHTVQETEDWFDKVTVSRNMKELTNQEGDYEEFFQKAMKKFGIKSPDELGSDEKKKEFFNYVDKNYKAKAEGKLK